MASPKRAKYDTTLRVHAYSAEIFILKTEFHTWTVGWSENDNTE